MKALHYNKKEFKFIELEKPSYTPNQVLVRIVSTSLNAGDYRLVQLNSIPKSGILGNSIAGIVEEVGANVQTLKVGDRIVCDTSNDGFGGLAEYIAINESLCIKVPLNVSLIDASACPVASTTALNALRVERQVKEDDRILIIGASGGVGTYMVQLAKQFNAHVTSVVSTHNMDQARDLGSDIVLNYKKDDITQLKETYDRIIVINGSYPLSFYQNHLKPNGLNVMVGGPIKQFIKNLILCPLYSLGNKKFKVLNSKSNTSDLEEIINLVSNKKIKPIIEKVYPFDKAIEAYQEFEKGHSKGKIVTQISSETK
ncbi:MAG: NAD(P)-dependent alcohol dehydrogenase [Erysipelotrichaceae bacterium]